MKENNAGAVTTYYKGQEVKVVWREDGKNKTWKRTHNE